MASNEEDSPEQVAQAMTRWMELNKELLAPSRDNSQKESDRREELVDELMTLDMALQEYRRRREAEEK
ncbi:hypothetical protein [Lignipirellula cremea]|uniref:Uncharacterized protein n=1 Tax=Lignipirellula cremea TaxID=2528010 RepID=A0A518E0Q5_9BACT|nr:hypothetical protein [Lignipirellula cremea]QDU97674.1 hypothetical protein Pla8534_55270 [Lignipirellula cremea]